MRMRRVVFMGLCALFLCSACTAQQWEGTKTVVALVALGTLMQAPVATATCRTITQGYIVTTVCSAY